MKLRYVNAIDWLSFGSYISFPVIGWFHSENCRIIVPIGGTRGNESVPKYGEL